METDRASNDDVSVAFEWQRGIFIVQHLLWLRFLQPLRERRVKSHLKLTSYKT